MGDGFIYQALFAAKAVKESNQRIKQEQKNKNTRSQS